jgi:thiamine biosynthesis lipoprotein
MASFMRWNRLAIAAMAMAGLQLAAAVNPPAAALPVHQHKYAMGTVFDIVAYADSPERASAAIEKAFQEIVRLDQVMSNYKPESELSYLNRSAHFHVQNVELDLYRAVEESLPYSRMSAGKFDITVGPLSDLWKAAVRGGPVPSAAQLARIEPCVGYTKIRMVPPRGIEFLSPCLQIDLGAIGKGYAVDRAVGILRAQGIGRALVNAGGSTIYGMGSPPGQAGWAVTLRDPSHRVDPEVSLHNNAVSTSEQTAPSLLENRRAGHIVDPRTGLPVDTRFAVSVLAENATAADALSTTLLLVGPEKGRRLVSRTRQTAAIWISTQGQTITASSGPQISLRTTNSLSTGGSR